MSVPVPIDTLRHTLEERGPVGFLLTVSDDARPHAVQCPVVWEGDRLAVGASAGVAELPADRDIAGLLARADAAMYARKRERKAANGG